MRRINLLQRDNDDEFDEVLSRRQSLNKYTEWQRVPEDSMEFQKVLPGSTRFHCDGLVRRQVTWQPCAGYGYLTASVATSGG